MGYIAKDIKAITAACSVSFSNEITEGHVNDSKRLNEWCMDVQVASY